MNRWSSENIGDGILRTKALGIKLLARRRRRRHVKCKADNIAPIVSISVYIQESDDQAQHIIVKLVEKHMCDTFGGSCTEVLMRCGVCTAGSSNAKSDLFGGRIRRHQQQRRFISGRSKRFSSASVHATILVYKLLFAVILLPSVC